MSSARKYLRTLAIAYGLCLLVQLAGGYFTQQSVTTWYTTLAKSPLTPPGMYFGIVWTALYLLMAVAAACVVHSTGRWNTRPMRWWLIQLLSGLAWCAVFFGQRLIAEGFYLILFSAISVLVTVRLFWRIDRRAGLLMLPLLAWISFATYLSYYLMQHN